MPHVKHYQYSLFITAILMANFIFALPEAFRASVFHVLEAPKVEIKEVAGDQPDQSAKLVLNIRSEFIEDALLIVENGKILKLGHYEELIGDLNSAVTVNDFQGRIIVPGFIDTHIHYPQTQMMAAHGEQLLEWLNRYTFPTEKQFADKTHAKKVSKVFLDELLRNGTTTALVFGTVHPQSVDAFFEEAQERKLRMIAGKVMMDRIPFAPEGLRDTAQSSFDESKELIEKWHNKDRLLYAITPRFAITSTPEQLAAASRLKELYPDVYIHTHVSENKSEVDHAKSLFPEKNPSADPKKARSYLGIYNDFGLVRKKSVFAHGIYLEDQDYELLSKKEKNGEGSAISFCPTSNLYLGSGLFPLQKAENHGIRVGLGTDIGAGTSFNMLQTMNEGYKVVQLQKAYTQNPKDIRTLSAENAFYLATLGSARALHLEDKLGNFETGKEADFVVLNPSSTPLTKFRMEHAQTWQEKLFAMMMMGDDRMIEATYILGKKWQDPAKAKAN